MSEIEVQIPRRHEGQQNICANATRHTVVMAGRRVGKSTLGMCEALECFINGGKVGLFYPTHKYSLDAWRELTRRLRQMVEAVGGRISEQERRIEANGGVVEVWSVADNEDVARGRFYDLAIVDEAGLIENLSVVWEAAIEPTLADRNGRSWFLGTPKGIRNAFSMMFEEASSGADPEWSAFRLETVSNSTIPGIVEKIAKLRARAERRGTLALFDQEYRGIAADDGSSPIGLEAIAAVATPAFRASCEWAKWTNGEKPRQTVAYGCDLARSTDFTVLFGFDTMGRWTEVHRWQGSWTTTKARLLEIVGLELPVTMDATGVGSPIVEDLQLAGMNCSAFVFSYRSRASIIESLITGIHGKRLTLPDNFVRKELESLSVQTNLETSMTRYSVPSGMHDDGIMALCLAWRAFSYDAPAPSWPVDRNDNPWTEGQDASKMRLEEEADDLFDALGAGW
jgi:phage FluMu gp28-like protein